MRRRTASAEHQSAGYLAGTQVNGEPMQVLSVPMLWRCAWWVWRQVGYRLTDIEEAQRSRDEALVMLIPLGLVVRRAEASCRPAGFDSVCGDH
ncbi:MAG: hypothetical protein QM758_04190 [Armatimonas sp.]